MGRPPSTGGPAFRFNGAEVMEMEAVLKDHNNNMPAQEVLGAIADKFSNSLERKGKFVVQTKQIWNWFQNKRYAIRAKGYKTPTKLTVTSVQSMSSGVPMQSVPVVSTTPVVKVTTAVPVASSATVISGEDNLSSSRLSQPVVDPSGLVSSDNTPMEFEARSARDGAWYDVASFLSLRNMEAGCPEVLVRFAGFGPEEDEWINVTTHVRHRSLPCEFSECVAVLPGDLILCFQEGKEQALYFDAHVLDAQRRRHDARGCRCRFLVRYDHDQSEEIVPLRKICRRPETDYRLQQLHAMTEVSAEQRKSAPSTGVLSEEQHKPVRSLEQIKTNVDSPISKPGISTSETTSVQKPLAPLGASSASEEQKGAMDYSSDKATGYSNAAPTNTQLPHPEVINLDPEIEVENNPHEVKSPTDDMAVDQPTEKHTDIMPTNGIDATSTHNMTEEVRNEASLSAVTENVYKPEQVNPEPLIVKTNITTDEGHGNIDHDKHDPVETNITTDDEKANVDHSKFDPASSSSTPADAGFSNVEGSGPKLTSSICKISLEKEVPEGKTDVDSGSATLTSTTDAVEYSVEVSNPSNSLTPNDDVENVENFTDDDAPTEYGIK